MSKSISNLQKLIKQALNECGCQAEPANKEQEPFYYLAPEVVGSINNLKINPTKDTVSLGFNSTDGKKFSLIVPGQTMNGWMGGNEDGTMVDFIKAFLGGSKPSDETGGEDMLDEIVDEDGNLIGAKDQPPNANFKQVGGSRRDSDAVIKQVVPKSRRYYGDMGLGFITW